MSILKKLTLITLTVVFSLLLLPGYSNAQGQNSNSLMPKRTTEEKNSIREEKMELKEQAQDKVQQRVQNRCDLATQRISNRISAFEDNKDRHLKNYENFTNRLNEIVTKLQDKGFDTTDLENDIVVLEGLVDEYTVLYTEFINILTDTQALDCGNEDGAYKDLVLEAKDKLHEARNKRREIMEYYRDTVREHIKDIREQAANLNEEE
ncbi:MAG: hypothetical protein ACOZAO_02130 [Patescibacteria group bacterium]